MTTRGGGGAKLIVGSDVPYPPFEEFGKSKTEFKGFDIELIEAIAEKIDREVEFKDTSFDTIFRDLAQGKFDAVASATTITDEREETVDFTNPYYLPSAQSIVVKKGDSGLKSAKDLEGKSSESSRERPARNTSKKKSTPRNSAPTRRAPTRSRPSRRARSTPS